MELCCLYWSRLGDLPYALALQKLCMGNADLLQELEKNQIYEVIDGKIQIIFLDEQLTDFDELKEKRRKAANKRWKNASAMQVHSKSNAKREDKIREEKKKEENINIPSWLDFINYAEEKAVDLNIRLDESKVKAKYQAWKENGWMTGGKKPHKIKNWKSTLLNTINFLKLEHNEQSKKVAADQPTGIDWGNVKLDD